MNTLIRYIFFGIFIRVITLFVLGMNVRNRQKIPTQGPAVIIANHNSHLDTIVLMSLIPLRDLKNVQPVAAADYFLRNKLLAWFSVKIIGILPIKRKKIPNADIERELDDSHDPHGSLAPCIQALKNNKVLIFFPEGSRGEPERLTKFKSGISHLMKAMQGVAVTPIFLHGLGKALPKGEALLVPFFCDVFVGDPIKWPGDRKILMSEIDKNMNDLAGESHFESWD